MHPPASSAFPLAPTPLCDLLGCRQPLILAGMGGVARSELLAAVTGAGGFGFLGMVREPGALIRAEVARVRQRTSRPFGVNLIPAATPAALRREQLALCIALRVPVVGLFWEVDPAVIAQLREAGMLVVYQVGSALEALQAQEAGAQVLIALGVEAGGHARGRQPLAELLEQVLAQGAQAAQLRDLLWRVDDASIRQDLARMRQAHEACLARICAR